MACGQHIHPVCWNVYGRVGLCCANVWRGWCTTFPPSFIAITEGGRVAILLDTFSLLSKVAQPTRLDRGMFVPQLQVKSALFANAHPSDRCEHHRFNCFYRIYRLGMRCSDHSTPISFLICWNIIDVSVKAAASIGSNSAYTATNAQL